MRQSCQRLNKMRRGVCLNPWGTSTASRGGLAGAEISVGVSGKAAISEGAAFYVASDRSVQCFIYVQKRYGLVPVSHLRLMLRLGFQ